MERFTAIFSVAAGLGIIYPRVGFVLLFIAFLLTGCATYPELAKPGASAKELEADRTLCQYETEKSMVTRTRSSSDVILNALDHRQDRDKIMNLCLQTKGWR